MKLRSNSVNKLIHSVLVLATGLMSIYSTSKAQDISIDRVEPPNWWVGMENEELQLMVYGEDIGNSQVDVQYEGVQLKKVHRADNPNYLFLDLLISPEAQSGKVGLEFTDNGETYAYQYPLQKREEDRKAHLEIDQRDVIYLITPDRYVNGDPSNDEVSGLKEGKDMSFHSGRHGGDLKGIRSKIDYLDELGVTALWLNPVLLNDMPEYSYHGYATTDYYKVDPRYGSNEEYKKLADELHKRDMKLIMDMIFNHCGSHHWWMDDMPFEDWVHFYPDHKITNHAKSTFSDPYAAEHDQTMMEKGWFVPSMPDLNHDNPFMANYLIQNSIWWIEYAGLDGIRMDTYPYNEPEMMIEWAKRVYQEYPDLYLLGETWVDNEAEEAYWAEQDPAREDVFNTHMSSMTDFPLCFAIHNAFKEDGNVYDLYKVLSKDFLYYKPQNNTIFADNHDMDRYFYTIGEDLEKFKLAMTFMLTTRGIPQIYYGTEILMNGHGHHGVIREDFPGGWKSHERDAYTAKGRTAEENEAFTFLKNLLNWRKNSEAVPNGSLKHFVPHDNVYVYNRKAKGESVLVVINNNNNEVKLNTDRYAEVLKGYQSAKDVITGKEILDFNDLSIPANEALILELDTEFKTSTK